MPTAFASEAGHIRDTGNLSVKDIAQATGATDTTVRAWLRGSRSPSGRYAERLAELSAIVERLVQVMDPSYVPVWMRKPICAPRRRHAAQRDCGGRVPAGFSGDRRAGKHGRHLAELLAPSDQPAGLSFRRGPTPPQHRKGPGRAADPRALCCGRSPRQC
jgi:transcriptional regulator with XRE-family HTH domain